jgi:hypothetical protein
MNNLCNYTEKLKHEMGGKGKSSAEGKIISQQCKQANALTLFLPK